MAQLAQPFQRLVEFAQLRGGFEFHTPTSSGPPPSPADRILVHIPYCETLLRWQVLFSYADPQAPPDVLFPEEHLAFLAFVSDEQERPAMLGADWSVAEAASLLLLLRQLLASWRRFNLQLLHRRPRSDAARPLISFLANTDASEVDVLVLHDDEVRVSMPMESVVLPPPHTQPRLYFSTAGRVLSCRYTSLSGPLQNFQPPTFPAACVESGSTPAQQMVLSQFVVASAHRLSEEVDRASRRTALIRTLLALIPGALEYDSVEFRSASFLCDHTTPKRSYPFVVQLTLTPTFPEDAPEIRLHSFYHIKNWRPITSVIKKYGYQSQWSVEQMAQSIVSGITSAMAQFYTHCSKA